MSVVPRRTVLRMAVAAAGAAALAACGAPPRRPSLTAPGRLPLSDGNPSIDPGRPLERGATLRVYQWRDYLGPDVIDAFVRRHAGSDVAVDVQSFTTIAEAAERLDGADGDFDVFFPTPDAMRALVERRLLRPLTHELLPNLRNLWPYFVSGDGPFYDPGQRYSVPYTVYATGIGWRRDRVRTEDAPDRIANPYDVYWNARYRGAVGIYDDYREAIALALLRRGESPNASDDAAIRRAVDDLITMAEAVDVEVSDEGAYDELQTGEYAIQQAWSGDLLSAKRFGSDAGAYASDVAFTWPRGGIVGCDLTAICARGRHPALAHAFVNHLLDVGVALANFRWNGYQPPVGDDPPPVTSALRDAILSPDDLDEGRFLLPLGPAADARWRVGWQTFQRARPSDADV